MSRFSILVAALIVGSPAVAAKEPQPGLTIQMGESWIFRVENGQPVYARKVDAQADPQMGELKVTLESSMGTMMSVKNNSDRWYNYRAFVTARPGTEGKATSVCTLGAGLGAFENWPMAIPAIRIADFTETEEGMMVCR